MSSNWKAHYAEGDKNNDVGWDTITFKHLSRAEIKDYSAEEEVAFRLAEAGVPVKVTNSIGEEVLQFLSQKPKPLN